MQVQVNAEAGVAPQELAGKHVSNLLGQNWDVNLGPYDLAVFQFNSPNVRLIAPQVGMGLAAQDRARRGHRRSERAPPGARKAAVVAGPAKSWIRARGAGQPNSWLDGYGRRSNHARLEQSARRQPVAAVLERWSRDNDASQRDVPDA